MVTSFREQNLDLRKLVNEFFLILRFPLFSSEFFTYNQIIRYLCKEKARLHWTNFSDVVSFGEISNHSEERKRERETFLLPLNNSCCIVFRLRSILDSFCRRYYVLSPSCRLTSAVPSRCFSSLRTFLFASGRKKTQAKIEKVQARLAAFIVLCHQSFNSAEESRNPGNLRGKILETVQALNGLSGYRGAGKCLQTHVTKNIVVIKTDVWNFREELQDYDFRLLQDLICHYYGREISFSTLRTIIEN